MFCFTLHWTPRIALFFVVLLFTSCSDDDPVGPVSRPPLLDTLEDAYQSDSQAKLTFFFAEWARNSKPITAEQLGEQATWIQASYAAFEAFYDPLQLARYDATYPPEVGNDFYDKVRYVIVQGKLTVQIDATRTAAIHDFRPRTNVQSKSVVYLTDEYDMVLREFLGDPGESAEAFQRLEFLAPFVRIVPGHWLGWHLETHPKASRMELSEDVDFATVFFRIRYEGGKATVENLESEWQMTYSDLQWIE